MKIDVKPIADDVASMAKVLPEKAARRITISSVNDGAKRGETRMNKLIRDTLLLSRADVDDVITRRTVRDDANAFRQDVTVTRKPLFFKSYKPKATKKGLTVKFYKGGKRITFKTAFQDKHKGGNVFRRLGKKRLPITKMKGPTAIGAATRHEGKVAEIAEHSGAYQNDRFLSKLEYELQKIASKGR
jgi:hypothetical protein